MDRHTKKESYDGVVTKEEFEAIMNEESLSFFPALVNNMDENLSIHICEFIENPLLINLKLNQGKLIDVIKSSNKFHYDTKTMMIKFKKKPDRNILMLINFMKSEEPTEVKDNKEQFIMKLISECNKQFVQNKLKKIHRVGDSIHFVFEHEDISMEIEKFLLNLKSEESTFIQTNDTIDRVLLQEFKTGRSTVCLGAESLKRRVSAKFNREFESISAQLQLMRELLMNPVNSLPRRFSEIQYGSQATQAGMHPNYYTLKNENAKKTPKDEGKMPRYSAADNYGNLHLQMFNQTSFQKFPVTSTNKKNTNSRPGSFVDSNPLSNMMNVANLNPNSTNKPNFGNTNSQRHWSGLNKFDLVVARLSMQQMKLPKAYQALQMQKSMGEVYRRQHGSESTVKPFGEHKSSLSYPLFQLDAEYSYNFKEIMSVYNHLKFLKKLEIPEEFKDQKFVKEIMVTQARQCLDYSLDVPQRVNPRMSNDFPSYRYSDCIFDICDIIISILVSGSRNRKSCAGVALLKKFKKKFSIDDKFKKRDRSMTQNKSKKFK